MPTAVVLRRRVKRLIRSNCRYRQCACVERARALRYPELLEAVRDEEIAEAFEVMAQHEIAFALTAEMLSGLLRERGIDSSEKFLDLLKGSAHAA